MAYYEKLPIVLLSELAAGPEDSYNCRIAAWLLGHLGEQVSADDVARGCYVSKSAVSRFCRDIGVDLSSAPDSYEGFWVDKFINNIEKGSRN